MHALAGHQRVEARLQGWATLQNGDLIQAAERSSYDLLITADKNIQYQQNFANRKLAIQVRASAAHSAMID